MDDLTAERRFDSKATSGSSMCFGHVTHGRLYNQALEDVRSTGAGIKCLYCRAC